MKGYLDEYEKLVIRMNTPRFVFFFFSVFFFTKFFFKNRALKLKNLYFRFLFVSFFFLVGKFSRKIYFYQSGKKSFSNVHN